jgi:hypothetical protein
MLEENLSTHSGGETTCCYAKSEKSWVEDPDGIAWEAYHTMEDAQLYMGGEAITDAVCCTPETAKACAVIQNRNWLLLHAAVDRERCHDAPAVQRAVSVHRQFRAQQFWRNPCWTIGDKAASGAIARAASPRVPFILRTQAAAFSRSAD